MADDGWDVSDAISAPAVALHPAAGGDGWDVSDAIGPRPAPATSAYEAAGGRTTWGDVPHAFMGGVHGALADVGGFMAGASSVPSITQKYQDFAASQLEAQRASEQAMTPAAQAPGFFKHPITSTVEAIPPLAAVIGPSAMAGPAAPAVGAALMGAQGMGGAYNEMMQQALAAGMTPEEADAKIKASGALIGAGAINAAAGLFPEVSGPLSKIAVSGPVKQALLGMTADTVTFGATSAGGDIGVQRAEQAMGTRKDVDTGEVGQAFVSGLEQGAPFSLLGTGRHRDLSQRGGAPTVAREDPTARQDQAKPRASTAAQPGQTTPPAPPPSPTADPAVQAGLKGKPVTPGVKPPDQTVQQPGVAQPKPAPAPRPSEAPPAPDTTKPVSTPQPAQEASPIPAPAPATAVDPAELQRQHAELLDPNHPRQAMIYPPGTQPIAITEGKLRFSNIALDDGSTVQFFRYGPDKLTKDKVQQIYEQGRLDSVLQPEAAAKPSVAGAPAPAPEERPEGAGGAGAQAAPAEEIRAEPVEQPTVEAAAPAGQPEVVEPTPGVTEREEPAPAPVDPLEGSTLLAKSKAGIELHLMPDGSYAVRKMDGTVMKDFDAGQAKGMFPDAVQGVEEGRSEYERIREQADKERRSQQQVSQAAAEFKQQRRVLEAQGEAEERARQAQSEAQDKAVAQEAAKPVTRQTKEPEDQKPGKKSAEEKEAMRASNAVADQVARDNLPTAAEANAKEGARGAGGTAARQAVMARVQKMVHEAVEKKFQFMKMLKDRKDPELAHSASSILLHEAKRLADKGKAAKIPDYARFVDREKELLKGEGAKEAVLQDRRAEGKEFAAAKGTAKEKASEDVDTARSVGEEEKPDVAEEFEKAKERVETEKVAKAPGEERKLTDNERRAQEASERARAKLAEQEAREQAAREEKAKPTESEEGAYTAVKARTTGFQVEKKRSIPKKLFSEDGKPTSATAELLKKAGWTDDEIKEFMEGGAPDETPEESLTRKAEELEDERTLQTPNRRVETDHVNLPVDGKNGEKKWYRVKVRSNSNVRDMLTPIRDKIGVGDIRSGDIARAMLDKIVDLVGDVKVRYVSKKELNELAIAHGMGRDFRPAGFYDSETHQILISDQIESANFLNHVKFHEAIHAATSVALDRFPEFREDIHKIMDAAYWREAADELGGTRYAFKNEDEFIAEIFSNPRLREYLASKTIPGYLKKELKVNLAEWRRQTGFKRALKTLWDVLALTISKALKLPTRGVTYLEATLAAVETGMKAHAEDVRAGGPIRFMHEEDQEAFLRSPREQLSRVKDIDRRMAAEFAKDKWVNMGGSFAAKHVKALSGTWLNNIHGHLFEDAKGKILEAINHARDKVTSTYQRLMHDDTDIINRGYQLDKRFASRMGDYQRLVSLSNTFNIHADRPAPKVPKNAEDAARSKWQGNAKYQEARAIYDSLPRALQDRYTAEKNFYKGKFGAIGKVMIDKVLPLFDPPKGSTLEEITARAKDNNLTEDDWAHYNKLGVEPALRKATRMLNSKDAYFNSQRDGRWVVSGRYAMPKGGNEKDHSGSELPDNVREFNSEKEAHDYATATHMHAVTHEINYWTDKATGVTKRVPSDFATSDPGTETTKYQVRLERQNTQMADSKAMALRNRAAMAADGVEELSGVMDKHDEHAWSKLNSADQKAIERKIANSDMTEAEKARLRDMSRQMMLAGQGGMSAHMIAARKVAGARYDSAAGLHAYAKAANFHIARETHSGELDEAMGRLDDHEKAMQDKDPDNATRRSAVANEYRDRVYGRNADGLNSKVSPLFHRIMTYAFINFLARPSHIFLSQIHPWIYSVPMMGGRHGYWAAAQAQRQAMKDLGGVTHNLWEGAKAGADVFRAGREKDLDKAVRMARGADPIDRMIAGLKNPAERKFLQQMRETQHLHSAFDASVFEGGGMDRANAVMRQFTDAMEANNRLSTALAAYRLESKAHGAERGLEYARRVIEESHGVFSPTNTAPMFKNPIIKAAMQFRQQPMNLALMMYRNIGKAATGDSEARWALSYQLGTAAMLGGLGGMPMDLPKLAGLASQAVGGPAPSDYEDKLRRFITDYAGETAANIALEGLPSLAGALGPSLGHRAGYDFGIGFGEPDSEKPSDGLTYLAKQAVGATGGMAMDWLTAIHNAEQGEWGKAMQTALPGSLKDIAKAYQLATEGTTVGKQQLQEASVGEALLQLLGFSSLERERAFSGHFALQRALKAEQAEQKQTKGEQLKVKHQQSTLGVTIPKKQRAIASEYESAYQ